MLGTDLIKRIQELGEEKDVVVEYDGSDCEIFDSNVVDDKIQLSIWW